MMLPPVSLARAHDLLERFSGVPVVVVGDVMLDRFIVGRVTRISPEAPVPVVQFDHEMQRLGGAANVAHNVAALGGRVVLIAPTGLDEAASALAQACRDADVSPHLVGDSLRRTTTKVRIVTERNQQVARVDYEHDAEVAGDVEARLIAAIRQVAGHAAVFVVSDYLKGGITEKLMQVILDEAAGRPVLVDPKIPHIDYYRGATLITPNSTEAEAATLVRIRDDDSARTAAHRFLDRAGCQSVLITRGDQGMWLLDRGTEGSLPATAREVSDVTGAGDTVIATLAVALGAGATTAEAAWLANEAAAVAVSRFGPATVNPGELWSAVETGRGSAL